MRYIDCLWRPEAEEPSALTMGRFGHEFIENGGEIPGGYQLEQKDRLTMLALLQAYCVHYGDAAFYEGAEKEKLFQIHARPSWSKRAMRKWRIAGVIDVVMSDRVVDHKFVGQLSSSYMDECQSSIQRIYCVAMDKNIMEFNVARKPLHKFNIDKEDEYSFINRISEAILKEPDKYFWRQDFVIPDKRVVMDYFCDQIKRISRSMSRNDWPQNWHSCVKWNRRCSYFDVCHSLNGDMVIQQNFIRDENKRHEELKRRLADDTTCKERKDSNPF
jgi:hypothetical protein